MTPEARARVTQIKNTAAAISDVLPTDPKVHDFMRNGQGPGDVLWLVGQLEKALETTDEAPSPQEVPGTSRQAEILGQIRTLVGADADEQILDKIALLVAPSSSDLPAGYNLALGDNEQPEENDDDFDDDDDNDEYVD